ncbi:hypothetical protein KCH_63290 [Kitasatospora cheerisanensis KCTC 2395]|uniref:Uncharacterized protein n=1 Tax=Kitasatospora cheerisanensis KCTC 2395 TaxID=1348663 RepID=A0A066YVD4_9ACTN|nr:hypothetical protein KCH_63290 [Kitasatospora cheerisanensis KCTC 2395]
MGWAPATSASIESGSPQRAAAITSSAGQAVSTTLAPLRLEHERAGADQHRAGAEGKGEHHGGLLRAVPFRRPSAGVCP